MEKDMCILFAAYLANVYLKYIGCNNTHSIYAAKQHYWDSNQL
jgi:hypothetical protein